MSYLPCELHCHTVHSDGDFTTSSLQKSARENALSLIALTDHNTVSAHGEIDDRIIPVIRGIEWTTYFGHMLVLGAKAFADWRNAVPDNIDEKIREVKACGGTVGIAHPFQAGAPICTGGRWEFNLHDLTLPDYIEIWHGNFFADSRENREGLAFWSRFLDSGAKPAAVSGRDWHRPSDGTYAVTYLNIDGAPTPEKALEAIKGRRTVVSAGARFFFTVTQNNKIYEIGDTVSEGEAVFDFYTDIYARRLFGEAKLTYKSIRLVTNGCKTVKEIPINECKIKAALRKGGWYRAELWGECDGKSALLAVTSPIFAQ